MGNARTALYNWLFARHQNGVFVLRVEDTDRNRASEDAFRSVLEDLRWLGLEWDEGPDVGGPYAPYRQSERFDLYDERVHALLESGAAYRCYCTAEEIDEMRKAARAAGRAPRYSRRCRNLSRGEEEAFRAQGRRPAVRFAVPDRRAVVFEDVVRGRVSTESKEIDDFVIQRSDGSPTYRLAAAVDDVLMKITHVIRGEDLMAATASQLLLREALGIRDVPVFAHLPLLVTPAGRPLSKRMEGVAGSPAAVVRAYRDKGFLPEAMLNYLALLGWSYDDRTNIFSVDQLVDKFSLERVGKNPAIFDVAKLEWLNGHYIRQSSPERLADELVPFCLRAGLDADTAEGRARLRAVAPLLLERLRRLEEAPPMIRFLFERPAPDDKARQALRGQDGYLRAAAQRLAGLEKWTAPEIEEVLRALAEERGMKPKQAFQPIRAAVTGTLVSPPLFESLEILGREEALARLAAPGAEPGG